MKYLIFGLILLVGLAGHPPAKSPDSLRASASARFLVSAAGVETKVSVFVNEASSSSRVGLSIHQTTQSCIGGVCQEVPVISGYSYQDVLPIDALFDRFLGHASVHTTVTFHDDVANTDVPIRVDVVWTASGPPICDSLYAEDGCQRVAIVIGEVAIGPLRLVPGQTVPDGRIAWRLWHLPTSSSYWP